MKSKQYNKNINSGFALLITLVVVSIILAVGLSLLQVTLKQVVLSSLARESEVALYAANTTVECMQYHRAQEDTRADFLNEGSGVWPPAIECADVTPNAPTQENPRETTIVDDNTNGIFVYRYWYQYDLSDSNTCSETSVYIADLRDASSDFSRDISAYKEGLEALSCRAGTVCTTVFARGYNRPCNQLDSIFTVQRELTLEY